VRFLRWLSWRLPEPNQEDGRGGMSGNRLPLTLLPLPHLRCP